jgi:hypothetical protein
VLVIYAVYVVITIAMTIWVGRTLHNNGRAFLVRVFHESTLADSVNQLLLVGFYLVNIGFIALYLRGYAPADATPEYLVGVVTEKIGVVALVLGGMHFFNLYVFSRIWRGRDKSIGENNVSSAAVAAPNYRQLSSLVDLPGAPTSAAVPVPDSLR